jgi:hypothetical protein
MKLIFSFWFIAPALGQTGGGDVSTGQGLIGLGVILGIFIFLFLGMRNQVRNRERVAANKRAAEQAEIAREREKLIKINRPSSLERTRANKSRPRSFSKPKRSIWPLWAMFRRHKAGLQILSPGFA